MGKSYRPYLPDQEFLLPPSLRDWLPESHLVYFVSNVIDNLNLSAMDAEYGDEQRGQPPYDPRMMTKLLVYGYCAGLFSSRRIQQRLTEDIAFRVLAAGNAPNFRTISDFRKIQGLLTPFHVERFINGFKAEEMQFNSVSYNTSVNDDVFRP